MRHHYQITISDCRGARAFTLTQLMRRVALGALVLAAAVFLIGLIVIRTLNARVESLGMGLAELKAVNARIAEENQRLLARQGELKDEIERKSTELLALIDDLEQLETLVGVNPPPSLPVAERISVASHTAFEKRLMLASIPSGSPLEQAVVTSRFGMREHPVIEQTRLHGGVDLRASIGTEVRASADGVVEFAGNNSGSGMGKMIKIVHNYGFSTIYAHLDRIDVKVGDYVVKGQPIGRSGNTGLTEAPHLHYEVRYLGRRLDPAPFMNWSFDRFETIFEQEDRVQWESLARTVRNQTQALAPPSLVQAPSLSVTSP
ncbi:MAG: M23 family metallopeptidase [Wenzhouxiangellaceae bacterium]